MLHATVYFSNVDCEAIRARIFLKLGRLLSFLIRKQIVKGDNHRRENVWFFVHGKEQELQAEPTSKEARVKMQLQSGDTKRGSGYGQRHLWCILFKISKI